MVEVWNKHISQRQAHITFFSLHTGKLVLIQSCTRQAWKHLALMKGGVQQQLQEMVTEGLRKTAASVFTEGEGAPDGVLLQPTAWQQQRSLKKPRSWEKRILSGWLANCVTQKSCNSFILCHFWLIIWPRNHYHTTYIMPKKLDTALCLWSSQNVSGKCSSYRQNVFSQFSSPFDLFKKVNCILIITFHSLQGPERSLTFSSHLSAMFLL